MSFADWHTRRLRELREGVMPAFDIVRVDLRPEQDPIVRFSGTTVEIERRENPA